jgi:hypothetical protein
MGIRICVRSNTRPIQFDLALRTVSEDFEKEFIWEYCEPSLIFALRASSVSGILVRLDRFLEALCLVVAPFSGTVSGAL